MLPNQSLDMTQRHRLFKLLTGKELIPPQERYGRNGCRYPSDYLHIVKGNIAIYPKLIVATFVNERMQELVNIGRYHHMKLYVRSLKSENCKYYKAPDLGCLAYIIIAAGNQELKELAIEAFEQYEVYLQNKISDLEINSQEADLILS
jgi:hypothetical protein